MEKTNFQNASQDTSSQNTTKVKFLFSTRQVTQEQLSETHTGLQNNTFSIEVKTLLTTSLCLIHLCNVKAGLNISSWLWTSNLHVTTPGRLCNWLPLDSFPAFIPLQELWEPAISLTGWQSFPSHTVLCADLRSDAELQVHGSFAPGPHRNTDSNIFYWLSV